MSAPGPMYALLASPANTSSYTCAEKCEHGQPCVKGEMHSVYHQGDDTGSLEFHIWTSARPGEPFACIVEEYEDFDGEDQ